MMTMRIGTLSGRMMATLTVLVGLISAPARAGYFQPGDFTSLGTLDLVSGNYTIDTTGAPVLKDGSNNVLFTGISASQGSGFNPNVSIFTFGSINIGTGVTIRVTGTNPLVLLSQSGVTLGGTIDASGFSGSDSSRFGGSGAGGAGGPGGAAGGHGGGFPGFTGDGPGGGPGGPGGIGGVQAAGGSYGGRGGESALGQTGATYGDLNLLLQAGSGGGGTGASLFEAIGAGGGGGGGAVELGALSSISFVGGNLIANGGGVGAAFAANAGGGSGGGLLIHAPTINFGPESDIAANGGDYFGGGGRVLFLTSTATIHQTGGNITASAGGGANNQQNGVIEYGFLQTPAVPEPSSFLSLGVGVVAALAYLRRSRAGK